MSTLTDQRETITEKKLSSLKPTTGISKSDLKTNLLSTSRYLSTLSDSTTDISRSELRTNDLSTPRFLSTSVHHMTFDPVSLGSSYPLLKSSTSNEKPDVTTTSGYKVNLIYSTLRQSTENEQNEISTSNAYDLKEASSYDPFTSSKIQEFTLTTKNYNDAKTVGQIIFYSTPSKLLNKKGKINFVIPLTVVSGLIFLVGIISYVGIGFRKKKNKARRRRNWIIREEAMMEYVINDTYGLQEMGSERCL